MNHEIVAEKKKKYMWNVPHGTWHTEGPQGKSVIWLSSPHGDSKDEDWLHDFTPCFPSCWISSICFPSYSKDRHNTRRHIHTVGITFQLCSSQHKKWNITYSLNYPWRLIRKTFFASPTSQVFLQHLTGVMSLWLIITWSIWLVLGPMMFQKQ